MKRKEAVDERLVVGIGDEQGLEWRGIGHLERGEAEVAACYQQIADAVDRPSIAEQRLIAGDGRRWAGCGGCGGVRRGAGGGTARGGRPWAAARPAPRPPGHRAPARSPAA